MAAAVALEGTQPPHQVYPRFPFGDGVPTGGGGLSRAHADGTFTAMSTTPYIYADIDRGVVALREAMLATPLAVPAPVTVEVSSEAESDSLPEHVAACPIDDAPQLLPIVSALARDGAVTVRGCLGIDVVSAVAGHLAEVAISSPIIGDSSSSAALWSLLLNPHIMRVCGAVLGGQVLTQSPASLQVGRWGVWCGSGLP